MKKILFSFFVLMHLQSYSQVLKTALPLTKDNYTIRLWKDNRFTGGFINNIRGIIIRDLRRRFRNATDTRWCIKDRLVTGYLEDNEEKITVVYSTYGYHIGTWKYYDSSRLDSKVMDALNGEVTTGYSIHLVTEFIGDDYTTYSISLQDPDNWCFLQLLKNKEEKELKVISKEFLRKN